MQGVTFSISLKYVDVLRSLLLRLNADSLSMVKPFNSCNLSFRRYTKYW